MVILELKSTEGEEKTLNVEVLNKIITIGRSNDADITLNYKKISREHLKIIIDSSHQFWIQDLNSRNGSYVGSQKLPIDPIKWTNQELKIPGYSIRKVETEVRSKELKQEIYSSIEIPAEKEIRKNLFAKSIEKIIDKELNKQILEDDFYESCLRELNSQEELKEIDTKSVIDSIKKEICGFGPLENLLKDNQITDILVNGPNEIFIEKNGKIEKTNLYFSSENSLIRMIKSIARKSGKRLDWNKPFIETRIKKDIRFHAITAPLTRNGPTVSIRKFPKSKLSQNELLQNNIIDEDTLELLKTKVDDGSNILISGATGSGKTTFLNTLGMFIPSNQRIITIEDCLELNLDHQHVVSLESREMNADGYGEVSIRSLLKNALRMRPDRIIIGECRGEEVIELVQALNTGHKGGMCTIHSNSCRDSLSRLELLMACSGYQGIESSLQKWIAGSFEILIHMARLKDGSRKVSEVMELKSIDNGNYILRTHFKRIQNKLEPIEPLSAFNTNPVNETNNLKNAKAV